MPEAPPRPADVPGRPLRDLLNRLPEATLSGDGDIPVTGITHDSRQVRPGDLYVARSGAATHGIEHVAAAVAAGATAVLTDSPSLKRAYTAGAAAVVTIAEPREAMGVAAAWVYGDPGSDLTLIGVTGTNGKTTTAYLIEAGLRAVGRRTGLIGTIETRIGDEAVPSARTTPESTELQALLAVMRERGVTAVAMEVSSHALALGRVRGTRFDVASFTNLSQDHLDFHRDMDDYYAAKAALFTPAYSRQAVICTDDAWGHRLATEVSIPMTTTGRDADAGWQRADETFTAESGRASLIDPDGGEHLVRCSLAGEVNLSNAALALVTLAVAGVDPDAAAEGIAGLACIPGRMERVDAGQPFAAFVDYAHTPDAVATVLREARGLAAPHGRVISVLGCGGDRDRAKRPLMGAAAAAGSDVAVLTSDNPRSEDPDVILEAMLAGVPARQSVIVEPDRTAAITQAVRLAHPGDVVIVAGKGHEQGQEIGGRIVAFDDRAVLRDALRDRLAGVT